jgi:hypothetical protein
MSRVFMEFSIKTLQIQAKKNIHLLSQVKDGLDLKVSDMLQFM